ncbi:MAG: glycosyltransferase [Robiginitomaculum sp.]|nr:MAG: glycosyltransferase [Robiginitomaculum sp.]
MSHIDQHIPKNNDRRRVSRGDPDRRQQNRHVWFLNATFDRVNFDQTVARINERPVGAPFKFVVTPNVDHLVRLQTEPDWVKGLYAQAWLTVCDSRILELIASISGERIDVTPGSDLTKALFENNINPDEPVTIIGANAQTIAAVTARYGLRNVNWYEPPMGLAKNLLAVEQCAEFVAKNPARFIFFCVGSPQQEMVARACLRRGDCEGTGLCVGASLDFLAGAISRAPQWMQRLRFEWLFRLLSEPKRMWRRYLVDGPKIMFVWWKWHTARAALKKVEKLEQTGAFEGRR